MYHKEPCFLLLWCNDIMIIMCLIKNNMINLSVLIQGNFVRYIIKGKYILNFTYSSKTLLNTYSRAVATLDPDCMCTQLCLTLCDPMDCRPPGSSVHVISQARILEWIAISSSGWSSWPRDRICISCVSCTVVAQYLRSSLFTGKNHLHNCWSGEFSFYRQ